jgi:Transposase DDE domain
MARVGTVAVDSTKLAANASLSQNRSYEGLREEARRIVEEAIATDAREDELYGEKRGDELPEELADPGTRKARIKELLERAKAQAEEIESKRQAMHERQAERLARKGKRPGGRPPGAGPNPQELKLLARKYNLTDPDSGIVRHRGMLIQGYNVQTAVSEDQVILAARATGVSADNGELAPTVHQAEQNLARVGGSETITGVLADGGYWNGPEIQALKARGIGVLVPPPKVKKRGRQAHPEVAAMQKTLTEADSQDAYRRRQQIVEPVFAHWKHIRGITRVLRRGKPAVQAEIDLIATTHNLLKLHRNRALAL